jgi:transposase InsO family protein
MTMAQNSELSLQNLFHDLGLEHQFLSPYTPPQNGVVERKNRTLCEMARTMLDEHRTPEDHVWFKDRWMVASFCDE